MKILCFDTETSDIPKTKYENGNKIISYPYALQISWVVFDDIKNTINTNNYIIRIPNDVQISKKSESIHKITKEKTEKGECIKKVLQLLNNDIYNSHTIIAHNIKFDKSIIIEECKRNNIDNPFINKEEKCTMMMGLDICKIPYINFKGERVLKFPKLIELHNHLFKEPLNENYLHDALCDTLIAIRCYVYMKSQKDLKDICNLYDKYHDKKI